MSEKLEIIAPDGASFRSADGTHIYGLRAMELGPIRDARPWLVDEQTLEQLVQAGESGAPVKVRMTHPKGDDLFLRLGHAINWRRFGNVVRVDVRKSEVADKSPHGDLWAYALSLLKDDPSVGLSIVPGDLTFGEPDDNGDRPIRIPSLLAVDLVGSPAAVSSAFQKDFPMAESKPAEQLGENDAAIENVAEGVADVKAMSKPYVEAFGKVKGISYLLEGLTIEQALRAELKQKDKQLDDLRGEFATLQGKVNCMREAMGEQFELEFSEPRGEDDRDKPFSFGEMIE